MLGPPAPAPDPPAQDPAPAPAPAPPAPPDPTTSAWWATARCEEGGRNDPTFGYLGIYPATWHAYGGPTATAGDADFWTQVQVAERIQADPPDYFSGGSLVCTGPW